MLDYTGMLAAIKRFTDLMANFVSTAPVTFVGEYKIIAGSIVPDGWLLCNGQTVSINDYPDLFGQIGVTYGGNGTTNFKLPDFRGRVGRGYADGQTVGTLGGRDSVTLANANLPSHAHLLNGANALATTVMKVATTGNDGTDTMPEGGVLTRDVTAGAEVYAPESSLADGSVNYGSVTTSISGRTETIGGAASFDITPAYVGVNWIIACRGKTPVAA